MSILLTSANASSFARGLRVGLIIHGTITLTWAVTVLAALWIQERRNANGGGADFIARRWGFDDRPTTETCYRQERTAILLSSTVFFLGVDQFYAHNWALAVGKLLTGLVPTFIIVSLILLFCCGCGCVRYAEPRRIFYALFTATPILVWATVDTVLWIVGGYYHTPGCP